MVSAAILLGAWEVLDAKGVLGRAAHHQSVPSVLSPVCHGALVLIRLLLLVLFLCYPKCLAKRRGLDLMKVHMRYGILSSLFILIVAVTSLCDHGRCSTCLPLCLHYGITSTEIHKPFLGMNIMRMCAVRSAVNLYGIKW